ncbi:histidine utilization repressor [Phenylobacterium sp.]|uniref:histidine utilization repressor n=1 Tax=Phenylobacterium sp. TaxID=1871053 RepID=UPI0025E8CA67|nr:histidine utilization repressor [Phenylobacterium sp.]MBX3484689.1 histidine utilization repressor [Phenylobacterium sp.]MCW5759567.1 histidine utilization repressor [Phenylobacterium sp.]
MDKPLYVAIRERLEQAIVSGEWPPGRRLPSEKELAAEYGCARMTVSKAVTALADAGLVTRRRRAGTVVAEPRPRESLLQIHDIPTEVRAAGRAYGFEVLDRAERKATAADAGRIGLKPGQPVLALTVLHRADGTPFALEERLISLRAVPDARAEAFDAEPPGSWLQARLPWTDAEHHILALNADARVAARLEVDPGAACLCDDRRSWHGGTVVTHVRLTYPGDRRLVARFHAPGSRGKT